MSSTILLVFREPEDLGSSIIQLNRRHLDTAQPVSVLADVVPMEGGYLKWHATFDEALSPRGSGHIVSAVMTDKTAWLDWKAAMGVCHGLP